MPIKSWDLLSFEKGQEGQLRCLKPFNKLKQISYARKYSQMISTQEIWQIIINWPTTYLSPVSKFFTIASCKCHRSSPPAFFKVAPFLYLCPTTSAFNGPNGFETTFTVFVSPLLNSFCCGLFSMRTSFERFPDSSIKINQVLRFVPAFCLSDVTNVTS